MRAIPREVDDAIVRDADDAYALGLWCADGYWWSSSIGISNVEADLVLRFGNYLSKALSPERLRLRIYEEPGSPPDQRVLSLTDRVSVCAPHKMKRTAYHLYVNSRPLLRSFFFARERLESIPPKYLGSYFAGRFDGDGSLGETPRIAYTSESEARLDAELLEVAGINKTSVFYYKKANEFCVYIHRSSLTRFEELIEADSWKINRRFTP